MAATKRQQVNKDKSAKQFNRQTGRTHPYNMEAWQEKGTQQQQMGLMRGGWRL